MRVTRRCICGCNYLQREHSNFASAECAMDWATKAFLAQKEAFRDKK